MLRSFAENVDITEATYFDEIIVFHHCMPIDNICHGLEWSFIEFLNFYSCLIINIHV